ncbi:type VI secretion protein [Brenneria alni]|uniref:Type VI secretion protein n=1 Tax=Brenneria alni TaxID=71656 RepID=A0A421DM59_9GAMM|nr:type VI secretion protein [Brenneria alni]
MNGFNQQLSLLVLNSEQLEGNSQVQYQFGQDGGTLGASNEDSWRLKDRLGAVSPAHARIEWLDGRFCLCDVSGQTFINGSTSPIGPMRKVFLQQGDELIVGPFRIGVHLGPVRVEPELDQILGNRQENDIDDWFDREKKPVRDNAAPPDMYNDPLWVLQQERQSIAGLVNQEPDTAASPLSQASSLSASEDAMDQKFIELPTIQGGVPALNDYTDGGTALSALMRGLGRHIQTPDTQQADAMLEEMGKTVRALVEGLLTLQQEQAALADKHLRPIEDNPLRLGLDYDETLALLFAEGKSPVHLSAPAAVAEVLRNVRIHHIANQQAIGVALESILQAFSPDVLLERFGHYRRSGEATQADDSWVWSMYQHYFRELTSIRQQGFQKLFQQVYSQAYDRAVRERQGQR